jgi:hypothetical protein
MDKTTSNNVKSNNEKKEDESLRIYRIRVTSHWRPGRTL